VVKKRREGFISKPGKKRCLPSGGGKKKKQGLSSLRKLSWRRKEKKRGGNEVLLGGNSRRKERREAKGRRETRRNCVIWGCVCFLGKDGEGGVKSDSVVEKNIQS